MKLFQSPDETCPANIKRFLCFSWEGSHGKAENIRVEPWGASDWRLYEVTARCKDCGATISRFGLSEVELIRAGFGKHIPKEPT